VHGSREVSLLESSVRAEFSFMPRRVSKKHDSGRFSIELLEAWSCKK